MNQATLRWSLRSRVTRRLGALLCFGLFVLLEVVVASAPLHQILHADASLPGHHCVITLLAQGQLSAPELLAGVAVVVSAGVCLLLLIGSATPSSVDYRLSPSRVPPRF